ncbi:hypothetical protein ACFLUB_00280 [Chloroflexota bacterium]
METTNETITNTLNRMEKTACYVQDLRRRAEALREKRRKEDIVKYVKEQKAQYSEKTEDIVDKRTHILNRILDKESKENQNNELYEGEIQLKLVALAGSRQLSEFKKYLCTVQDIRIIFTGWSEVQGYEIIISVEKPLLLTSVLRNMPLVENVVIERNRIKVIFRSE